MGAAGASDIEESENERFFEILKKVSKSTCICLDIMVI